MSDKYDLDIDAIFLTISRLTSRISELESRLDSIDQVLASRRSEIVASYAVIENRVRRIWPGEWEATPTDWCPDWGC